MRAQSFLRVSPRSAFFIFESDAERRIGHRPRAQADRRAGLDFAGNLGPVSDLTTSMAIARQVRGKVSQVTMIAQRFESGGNPR